MTIEKTDATAFNSEQMKDIIHTRIPEAKLLTDVGTELTFQLPFSSSDKFQGVFEYIDAHERELGVQSYGMSVTTLEEVFIRVAEGTHTQADAQAGIAKMHHKIDEQAFVAAASPKSINDDVEAAVAPGANSTIFTDFKRLPEDQQALYFLRHCYAMIMKRGLYFIRDIKAMIAQYFAPILIVLIGLLIIQFTEIAIPQPSKTLSHSLYNKGISPDFLPTTYSNDSLFCLPLSYSKMKKVYKILDDTSSCYNVTGQSILMNSISDYSLYPFNAENSASSAGDISQSLLDSRNSYKASQMGAFTYV